MPRNKYPEETVQIILDTATRLFIENGYENTTVLDIVEGLGGMTRGAVYHHFKNKEEILEAITTRLQRDNNPFERARKSCDDGLGQLKLSLRYSVEERPDTDRLILNRQMLGLLQEPKYLFQHFNECFVLAETEILPMIEKANAEGSLNVVRPKQAAELMMYILNLWINYSPGELSYEEYLERLDFAQETLESIGLPVLDGEVKELCLRAYGDFFIKGES